MPASRPDNHEQLPPLAAEDYTCDVCALVYSEIAIDAVGVIAGCRHSPEWSLPSA